MSTNVTTITAVDYVSNIFQPGDRIAIMLLRTGEGEKPIHQYATAAEVATDSYMAGLAKQNDAGYNIYLAMNPLKADRRIKENVSVTRSVYLDLDQDGDVALAKIASSTAVPTPSYVLQSSPGKYQIIWSVEGMTRGEQESLLDLLIHEFGGDPAASDGTRVLRLPG